VTTLELAAEGYLGSLEAAGKTPGTIASYKAEISMALDELGDQTDLKTLTAKEVAAYFNSKRVMRLRSGKPKSQLSIDKSRRVFRQLLVWASDSGWIELAPLPSAEPSGGKRTGGDGKRPVNEARANRRRSGSAAPESPASDESVAGQPPA
jgi:hypothetical protein